MKTSCVCVCLCKPPGFSKSCQPWVYSLLHFLIPISLRFVEQLMPFPSYIAVLFFLFSLLAPSSSFTRKTHMHTHTHRMACTPLPVSQPSFLFHPKPPTSLLPSPFLSSPSLCFLLPRLLSLPETAATTCIASCYVGTMTTVMNSTWHSRTQADVSLCGCSTSNSAHVLQRTKLSVGFGIDSDIPPFLLTHCVWKRVSTFKW